MMGVSPPGAMGSPPFPGTRWLGRAAVGFVIYWIVALAFLHILRPDMDPLVRTMSEYMCGPYGWLMTTTFFALAVALGALSLGLSRTLTRTRGSRIGILLVYVAALGLVVAGVFPGLIGPPQPPACDLAAVEAWIQQAGPMHDISAMIVFLSLAIALPLLSQRFSRDEWWRSIGSISRGVAGLYVITFVGLLIVVGVGGTDFLGLGQRLVVGTQLAWFLVVGRRMAQLPP
ncbi:MAG: DUF998 domain-containing protein [Nitrospiraceae bacterium]